MQQKTLFSGTVLFLLLWMSGSHAQSGFGICSYHDQTVPSVTCYGPAWLTKTTVTGETKVAGPLKASQSSLSTMQVKGVVQLQDTTIKHDASIMGYLTSQNSHFEHGLSIATDKVSLSSSTVTGMLEINSTSKQPVVELYCHSTIAGSVSFGEQAGVVQMTSDSLINGKVNNGTIEIVKRAC